MPSYFDPTNKFSSLLSLDLHREFIRYRHGVNDFPVFMRKVNDLLLDSSGKSFIAIDDRRMNNSLGRKLPDFLSTSTKSMGPK